MTDDPVHRLRELCLALPAVSERLNHDEPSWTVRGRTLVQFSERHPPDRLGFWAPAGEDREAMVKTDPERFFRPPFVGRGWVGVYLDVPVDWAEVREIIVEAYRVVAPKKLLAELDERQ